MITILQAPNKFQPAYNPINYVVSSDKTAEDNFSFVADIYITGVSNPSYVRIKQAIDPVAGFGVFDIHRIVENFLSHDIGTGVGWQRNTNSFAEYQVKFGEEFGLSTSGTTVYSNLTLGSVNYAYNAVFDFLGFQDYTQTPYVIAGSSSTNKWLTNQPTTVNIGDSERAWLHAQTDTSGSIYYAEIKTYDSAGALIQTIKILNPYQAASSDQSKFIRFGSGPDNLNDITIDSIEAGAQPFITASVSYYTVQMTTFAGAATSELKTFTIIDQCSNYTKYRLHFLNKMGGFDSFTFNRVSRPLSTIERQSYKKNLGTLTPITGAFGYAKSDRQDTVFDTNIKDNITINSDWITETESAWLEELVTSPVVFLDDATHGLVAINITDTGYETRKSVNDKVFNLVVNFQYTYNRKRQRG